MSLEQGTWTRTALMVVQTIGTIVSTYYGGPWAGLAASAFHTAFWAWYDTTNAKDARTEQESIADLHVQGSGFGQAVPQVFGTYGSISGNVIWATEKVEHVHTDKKSGGKGGGPKQITVTKTYSMSMALGICDTRLTGQILRIRRIFRDLKLIADINQVGDGAISTFSINSGGTGYAVNDIGGVDEGNLNASYIVTAVGGGGVITALDITNPGTGYAVNNHVALKRGSGSGNNAFIDITSIIGNSIPANFTFYPGSADQLPDPTMEAALGVGNVPAYRYLCYVVIQDENLGPGGRTFQYSFDIEQAATPTLPEVVTALCTPVGISGGALDVTDLPTGDVNMALVSIQAARAPLQILAQAYRFYVVESGTALKFREIGSGGSVAAIPETEIDAGEEESPGQGLGVGRTDETPLPTEVNVTYVDAQQNYQGNTQRTQLGILTGSAEDPRVIHIPLSLSAAQAKQIAQEELYQQWIQRETITTKLGRKYAALEPGDRVTITARGLTYPLVLATTTYGRPGLLELTGSLDAAFVRGAVGAPPGIALPPTQPLPSVRVTTGYLLNLPALGASDVPPRYHIAFEGHGTSFAGAALFRSVDAEASYQEIFSSSVEAAIGVVDTAIPPPPIQHLADDTTVITVVMLNNRMQLLSTSDAGMEAGQNLAVLGDEILSFGTATLIAPRTYTLSHLLRGRRGTEWATETHTAAETFVLLNTAVNALPMALSDRGVQRHYKTVTFDQSIAEVVSITFTPTAANLIPWAAMDITDILNGSDWELSWHYRPRFGGDWVTGLATGFDNDFAGFRVVIYADETYAVEKRSTVTDGGNPFDATALKSFIYTAAMQTADFGGAQTTLYYRIYQRSQIGEGMAENHQSGYQASLVLTQAAQVTTSAGALALQGQGTPTVGGQTVTAAGSIV